MPELPEEKMLEAVNLGHEKLKPVINAIINLAETCANEPLPVPEISEDDQKLHKILKPVNKKISAAYKVKDKTKIAP